jgi:hypothetical protein
MGLVGWTVPVPVVERHEQDLPADVADPHLGSDRPRGEAISTRSPSLICSREASVVDIEGYHDD